MSFQNAKIIDYLGNDDKGNRKFVILLPSEAQEIETPIDEITVAHDYIRFTGSCSFEMQQKDGKYPFEPKLGACNWVKSEASITIGIREFQEIILPYLIKHKYLQPEHIQDRTYTEDDEYYEKHYKLDKPRWKKGDKYPAYCFNSCIIELKEEDGLFYYLRRVGESVYDKVSLSLFNQIKSSIKLWKSVWEK